MLERSGHGSERKGHCYIREQAYEEAYDVVNIYLMLGCLLEVSEGVNNRGDCTCVHATITISRMELVRATQILWRWEG